MLHLDDVERALRWLLLYLFGICFVAIAHTIQLRDKAWTSEKIAAWKRTVFFLLVGWAFGKKSQYS